MKCFIHSLLLSLMFVLNPLYADTQSDWYMSISANMNFSVFSKSKNLDTQTEIGVFADAEYLGNIGLSAGMIYQNQGQEAFGDISNNINYLGARFYLYPESMPGKLTLSLETYRESESTTLKTTRTVVPDPGPGGGSIVTLETELINDTLKVINPSIAYLNYTKTFYADMGFAYSEYGATDPDIGELKVKQWSPTIGFSFNDQYDWFQLRYYNIDLSNDARSPGVTRTVATEFKITHWLNNKDNFTLNSVQFIFLRGERLFAVDRDARKIYNLDEMQTALYSIGGNWKGMDRNEIYIYAGLEEYNEPSENKSYHNVFVYAGYKLHW